MKVVGVHPIESHEDCHLVEVEFDSPELDYDWGDVTQEESGRKRDNWQVPYDETMVDDIGKRWAFFFHYLKLDKPLLTPSGEVRLVRPTALPEPLNAIEYEEP